MNLAANRIDDGDASAASVSIKRTALGNGVVSFRNDSLGQRNFEAVEAQKC